MRLFKTRLQIYFMEGMLITKSFNKLTLAYVEMGLGVQQFLYHLNNHPAT